MIERLLEAWDWPGNPLAKFIKFMKWKIDFQERDMDELRKYMVLMSPMHTLVTKLNADNSSTIHMVYPVLKGNLSLNI